MGFNPTDMQKKAINAKGNVLVSAAAGSGKTAVLTERVVSMLKDKQNPISADRLLIVTFTNAAAAEMRARIEKKLYEEIQKDPDDAALVKQKYLLASADISTIDSFCIRMLRENFEKCDIEPDFKIIEGTKETLFTNNILREIVDESLKNEPDVLKILLEITGCEANDENLCATVRDIQLYINQLPFPMDYINGFLLPYETEFKRGNIWFDAAFEIFHDKVKKIKNLVSELEQAAQLVVATDDRFIDGADKVRQCLQPLNDCFDCYDWDRVYLVVNNFKLESKPRVTGNDPNGLNFKKLKNQISSEVKNLADLFCQSMDSVQKSIKKSTPAVKLLVKMISELDRRLFEKHREENAYTFYNVEQMAFNLLCKKQGDEIVFTEYADILSNRYDEVLVDEFQDVNDLQDMLFYALSNREEKLFVVGDVKQSIYGFRGSNPENFIKKRKRYTDVDIAGENDSKKIILSDNFRSRKGVCEAVNYFFKLFLAGQSGGLVYDKSEYLNASGKFPESMASCCELLLVDKSNQVNAESLIETESKKIAEYILSVMDEGEVITDGDTMRCARFDDFAILLDKASSVAPVMTQVLNDYGIPVSYVGGNFLETYEVSTVMSLLQVIDNPKNDVELLATLMSPLFGFTADDMAVMRSKNKNCSLYSSLISYAESGDEKSQSCLKKLAELRQTAAVLPIDRLVSNILHSTDIFNQMSALPDGKNRRANLQALIGYAKGYYDAFGGGIYGFIKYMKSLNEKDFKVPAVSQGVKIMTMHGSKGLQFPVCIIAALSSKINKKETNSSIIHQKDFGIGFKYYDEDLDDIVEMIGHRIMKTQANSKLVQEKLRLLYVAMTRAIDRLCLVYSSDNPAKQLAEISEQVSDIPPYLSREFLEAKSNMGAWILAGMLLHPCGQKLVNIAGGKITPIEDTTAIDVNIIRTDSTLIPEVAQNSEGVANEDFAAQIKRNIDYVYPYERLRFLQAKSSVSAIVHGAENDDFAFTEKPDFMLKDSLSAAGRGTAMHNFMQFVNFGKTVDVDAETERLVEWKFITETQSKSLDKSALKKFFESDIYRRIMSADSLNREMRFLTELPASTIDSTIPSDDPEAKIIVQGAIDLCFVENDGVVVLDFKTDRVDTLDALVKCYGEQLEIYATAAQKIFSKPVKEKIIYSFRLGEWISF